MNNQVIQFVKQYCIRIAFGIITASIIVNQIWPDKFKDELLYKVAFGTAGALYFVHKQHMEDMELFHDLFNDFNERYNKLHNGLLSLHGKNKDIEDVGYRAIAEQYFNLCAEEYFYFRKDVIYPEVWASWCRGITDHLSRSELLLDMWRQDIEKDGKNNSYYGMTLDSIKKYTLR